MADLLTLTVDVSGVERKLSFMVEQAKDLDSVLRKWGQSYLKQKVQQRFDQQGPGWPPLKESTQARSLSGRRLTGKAAERAAGFLQRKLKRELGRAKKGLRRLQGDPILFAREEARQRHLAEQGKRSRSMADVLRSKEKAVERRKQVLAVFDKVLAGEEVTAATSGKGAERVQAKLEERLGRAKKKGGSVLGKIASSMKLEVKNGSLTFGSEVGWAFVHELGGEAAHGAKIPARPAVYLDEEDLDILVDMIVAWVGHSVSVE